MPRNVARRPHPVATILWAERELRGWSQNELAGISGIPQSSLSDYEKGFVWPNLATLEAWADALDYYVMVVPRMKEESGS